MKKTNIFLAVLIVTLFWACDGTWIMYDTSQKDQLYFNESVQTHYSSFALLLDDTLTVTTTVYLLGQPSDVDRTYAVDVLSTAPDGDTLADGTTTYPVVPAVEGEDFFLDDLVIPAGATEATLSINILRTEKMLDSCYVRIALRLAENDEFDVMADDSTRTSSIITPSYYYYITDGEPSCPLWWKPTSTAATGWDYDLGNFYPDKFRRLLDYFHEAADQSPVFYEYAEETYGYYLDSETATTTTKWWRQKYMSAWCIYVFYPLYLYYYDYYAENPDDPNWEDLSATVNINSRVGWANPYESTSYGWFN